MTNNYLFPIIVAILFALRIAIDGRMRNKTLE